MLYFHYRRRSYVRSKSCLPDVQHLVQIGQDAYVGFAEREGINLLQLKSTQRVSGTLGIQHINGYHSQLKTFMERFHGVATKYLNNYLVWHNLRNYAEGDFNFKESVWERHNAEAIYDDSKWTYMFRPPIPLPLAA